MLQISPHTLNTSSQAQLNALGRTEDLRFSPDGGWMAILGFRANAVLLVRVGADARTPSAPPAAHASVLLRCDAFNYPHGISWMDNNLLSVANREGDVCLFRLPERLPDSEELTLTPELTLPSGSATHLHTPGSLWAHRLDAYRIELLVCNNLANHVTTHLIHTDGPLRLAGSAVLVSKGIRIPDNVIVAPDRRHMAVSNHLCQQVYVYANHAELSPTSDPDAVLIGCEYPHGLAFTPDSRWLLVADAGAPHVHIYEQPAAGWTGTLRPHSSVPVMSDATFKAGHYNSQEGGPKGIDTHPTEPWVAITSEHQPLRWLRWTGPASAWTPSAPAVPDLLTMTLTRMVWRMQAHADAQDCLASRELDKLRASLSWRLTAPLRWAVDRLLHHSAP